MNFKTFISVTHQFFKIAEYFSIYLLHNSRILLPEIHNRHGILLPRLQGQLRASKVNECQERTMRVFVALQFVLVMPQSSLSLLGFKACLTSYRCACPGYVLVFVAFSSSNLAILAKLVFGKSIRHVVSV